MFLRTRHVDPRHCRESLSSCYGLRRQASGSENTTSSAGVSKAPNLNSSSCSECVSVSYRTRSWGSQKDRGATCASSARLLALTESLQTQKMWKKYRSPLSSRARENKARTDASPSSLIPQVAQMPRTAAECSAGRKHTQCGHTGHRGDHVSGWKARCHQATRKRRTL